MQQHYPLFKGQVDAGVQLIRSITSATVESSKQEYKMIKLTVKLLIQFDLQRVWRRNQG